jgi:hypothetical protein
VKMRSYGTIARPVSIFLFLVLIFGSLQPFPIAAAQTAEIPIVDVSHYAGNTDVYLGKKGICVKIVLRATGASWPPLRTDSHGRVVIYTGTVVAQSELQAFEAKCPEGEEPKAAQQASLGGTLTVAIPTKSGPVMLTLPDDMRAGDTISGTVVHNEDLKSKDQLEGAVIDVYGKQHKLRDRILTFVVPPTVAAGSIPAILRDNSGSEIARTQIPINQPAPVVPTNTSPTKVPPPNFQPPRIGQIGRPLSIPGNFDGEFGTTRIGTGSALAAGRWNSSPSRLAVHSCEFRTAYPLNPQT